METEIILAQLKMRNPSFLLDDRREFERVPHFSIGGRFGLKRSVSAKEYLEIDARYVAVGMVGGDLLWAMAVMGLWHDEDPAYDPTKIVWC